MTTYFITGKPDDSDSGYPTPVRIAGSAVPSIVSKDQVNIVNENDPNENNMPTSNRERKPLSIFKSESVCSQSGSLFVEKAIYEQKNQVYYSSNRASSVSLSLSRQSIDEEEEGYVDGEDEADVVFDDKISNDEENETKDISERDINEPIEVESTENSSISEEDALIAKIPSRSEKTDNMKSKIDQQCDSENTGDFVYKTELVLDSTTTIEADKDNGSCPCERRNLDSDIDTYFDKNLRDCENIGQQIQSEATQIADGMDIDTNVTAETKCAKCKVEPNEKCTCKENVQEEVVESISFQQVGPDRLTECKTELRMKDAGQDEAAKQSSSDETSCHETCDKPLQLNETDKVTEKLDKPVPVVNGCLPVMSKEEP